MRRLKYQPFQSSSIYYLTSVNSLHLGAFTIGRTLRNTLRRATSQLRHNDDCVKGFVAYGWRQVTDIDEKAFVAELRSGDEKSYETLVRSYGGRMLAVAIRFVRNMEDARECVQEAFLNAFKNLDRFEERSSLWTWLHQIVVRAALLKLRTRRRKPEDSLDELMPEFDANGCRVEPTYRSIEPAELLLAQRELRDTVRGAIDELPESYRSVLLLRDIEELDTEETAALLETTPGAVKTRLHRARAALKKLLEPVLGEEIP